ncbi:hypothetical protein T4B_10784 [Trichinella pseudospiralis]|uniref:Transmembrane protein n=1 Tax=Trichinella pseudospiralis TaxID=6337 RepID=A0A0V1GM01_TRIPS|nr:hypothetical protein T4B_10784 [Trichinella pseudospiralis]KRY99335.1 hypothetical protein T4C_6709 [Trichinella pseudospiralis]
MGTHGEPHTSGHFLFCFVSSAFGFASSGLHIFFSSLFISRILKLKK